MPITIEHLATTDISLSEITALYNQIAEKQVQKFRDRATALERLARAMGETWELFESGGDLALRVSSAEVDPTEDAAATDSATDAQSEEGSIQPTPTEDAAATDAQPTPTESGEKPHRGRTSPMLSKTVTLVREANPKRLGTRTHTRYELYREVTTAQEYMDRCLAAGLGTRREILSDLAWDSKQEFIHLLAPTA